LQQTAIIHSAAYADMHGHSLLGFGP